MKVVCIDNSCGNSRHFELGKIYIVDKIDCLKEGSFNSNFKIKYNLDYYIIKTEPWTSLTNRYERLPYKTEIWVDKNCFISLDEFRMIKLKEIL